MVVVDNCALIEIARRSELGRAIASLMLKDERAIAPDLIIYEATSASRKLAITGKLDLNDSAALCTKALSLIDEFVPAHDLREEVLRESVRLNHSTYDLFYFVLARRTGATLLTTDSKLAALCEQNGVNCIVNVEL